MIGSRIAYAFLMIAAAGVATWLVRRQQVALPLSRSERWTILASAFVGASFAAKMPFILFSQPSGPWWATWLGDGKTLLWGLAGGYVGVEVGKMMMDVRTRTGDTFVVGIATAIGVGRIGCLLFGCCYGTPTDLPWGVRFMTADDGGLIPRHPTQVYESLFHFSFAVTAAIWMRRRAFVGDWMPIYLIAYCAFRFGSEFVRPEERLLVGLTFYQWSSLAIAASMMLILAYRHPAILRLPTTSS